MFINAQPSLMLLCHFFVLCTVDQGYVFGGYYFQVRFRLKMTWYIRKATSDMWEYWRS
jgi:hypothetical protein